MEYVYVQNPNAKNPIILLDVYIDKHVGSTLSREILALKNAGKTEAEIWINSKGGYWSEGVSIVGSMVNSGINFTTVNMGYVDSTAGHIFQKGKKRVWMNYGLGLIHNIQGVGSASIKEAMNASVATMLSEKSNQTPAQIRDLMNRETMMTSELAEQYGFCDEVRPCSDPLNLTNSSDATEVIDFGEQQIKKLLPKNKNMEALNVVLGLTNEASEGAQLSAVNKIIEAKNAAETSLTAKITELTNANEALRTANGKLLTAENALLAATNESKKTAAAALVEKHRGTRIVDTPENILNYTNAAIADFDGTKTLIEGINLNTKAPLPPGAGGTRGDKAPVISVSEYMRK